MCVQKVTVLNHGNGILQILENVPAVHFSIFGSQLEAKPEAL